MPLSRKRGRNSLVLSERKSENPHGHMDLALLPPSSTLDIIGTSDTSTYPEDRAASVDDFSTGDGGSTPIQVSYIFHPSSP